MRDAFVDEFSTYLYSRGRNPTTDMLRAKLAALDGAEDALVFNSGASAIFSAVMSQVKSGDHIVCVRNPYSWAKHLMEVILPRFGVTTTFVDGRTTGAFAAALQPNTRVIYVESPLSWEFHLQDLAAVAELAKRQNGGIVTICDNSYNTPLYQQPIALGIALVLQSATKYISGHSDTVAGVLSGPRSIITRIFHSEFLCAGTHCTPFHAWLLLRGLRTLPARLERIQRTTRAVIQWLLQPAQQLWLESIIFPHHPSFPQYELAKRQMKAAGGLLTLVLQPTVRVEQIDAFCSRLKHILLAVSWGGHESLFFPRASLFPQREYDATNREHRMCRMYVGLEDADYLIADLQQAACEFSRGVRASM